MGIEFQFCKMRKFWRSVAPKYECIYHHCTIGIKIAKMLNFMWHFFFYPSERKIIFFSFSKACWSVPVFSLFPGVGTFLVFSHCASHIPSSCGNSSESRLDLFWDLSPVASYRDQSEDCLPPRGPPMMVSACHHWVSPMICFFLAQPVSWDPNAVLLFLQLHQKVVSLGLV